MDLFVAGPKGTLLRPSNTNDITVFWDQVARHGLGLGERTQRSSVLALAVASQRIPFQRDRAIPEAN